MAAEVTDTMQLATIFKEGLLAGCNNICRLFEAQTRKTENTECFFLSTIITVNNLVRHHFAILGNETYKLELQAQKFRVLNTAPSNITIVSMKKHIQKGLMEKLSDFSDKCEGYMNELEEKLNKDNKASSKAYRRKWMVSYSQDILI